MLYDRKIPAVRTKFWAVYARFEAFGPARQCLGAFPEKKDAETFVRRKVWLHMAGDTIFDDLSWVKPERIMIEEMPVTMKSWQP